MSTVPRLYIPGALAAGVTIESTAPQARHLGTVLRRAAGDPVQLFNGRDGEWDARIVAVRRDRVTLMVEHCRQPQATEPDIWLLFALLKRDATDLVVQKATELGVAALCPVLTARTNAGRVNEQRLAAIAIEAAEQCERLTIPTINAPRSFTEVLADWPADRRLIVAAERADAPPIRHVPGPAALLVGPEGGFTPDELASLRHHPAATLVSLGPRILRAETAAMAGLALLQAAGCG